MNCVHSNVGVAIYGNEDRQSARQRATVLKMCLVMLLSVALRAGSAQGGHITFLDCSYHVYGHVWTGPSDRQYDELSDVPVMGHVRHRDDWLESDEMWYEGEGGGWAYSAATRFSAYADAYTWAYPEEPGIGAVARAESICLFQTTLGQKDVVVYYYEAWAQDGVSIGHIRLTDVSSGEVLVNSGTVSTGLYARAAVDGWPGLDVYEPTYAIFFGPYWESFSVTFDPTHTYELAISVEAWGWPNWYPGTIWISTNLLIPAPGAILLGVIGTALVSRLRRRRVL